MVSGEGAKAPPPNSNLIGEDFLSMANASHSRRLAGSAADRTARRFDAMAARTSVPRSISHDAAERGSYFVGDQSQARAVAPPISIARSEALSRSVSRNGLTACSKLTTGPRCRGTDRTASTACLRPFRRVGLVGVNLRIADLHRRRSFVFQRVGRPTALSSRPPSGPARNRPLTISPDHPWG